MRSDSPYSEVSPAIPVEDFSGTGFSLCGFDFRRISKKKYIRLSFTSVQDRKSVVPKKSTSHLFSRAEIAFAVSVACC